MGGGKEGGREKQRVPKMGLEREGEESQGQRVPNLGLLKYTQRGGRGGTE